MPACGVLGLHVYHAELAVGHLAVGGHHPQKADGAAGRRDIRMVTGRHDDAISFAYDGDQLGILAVSVHQLNAPSRIGHIDIKVRLFEHGGVLVRRPRRPVAGLAKCYAGDDPAGLDVLSDDNIEIARGGIRLPP